VGLDRVGMVSLATYLLLLNPPRERKTSTRVTEDMFRMLDSSVADSQLATALEAQRKEEAATRDEVIQRAIARNEGILRQIKIAHPGRGRYP